MATEHLPSASNKLWKIITHYSIAQTSCGARSGSVELEMFLRDSWHCARITALAAAFGLAYGEWWATGVQTVWSLAPRLLATLSLQSAERLLSSFKYSSAEDHVFLQLNTQNRCFIKKKNNSLSHHKIVVEQQSKKTCAVHQSLPKTLIRAVSSGLSKFTSYCILK